MSRTSRAPRCGCAGHQDGSLTLWASTQRPFAVSWDLAEALGVAPSRIRVIKPHVGGGFGGKMETSAVEFSAVYLARQTHRPVKVVLTREEEFLIGRRRHASTFHIKTGVKRDGTITARDCRSIFNGVHTTAWASWRSIFPPCF